MQRKKNIKEKNYAGLVSAAEVLFADWEDLENVVMVNEETPETLLLEKTFFQNLSKEIRIMAEIIISLPEEMFLVNGRLKKEMLRKVVKEQTGWSETKIERVKERLGERLLGGCYG